MTENTLNKVLQSITANHVLDVATGTGFFAKLLKENLISCQSMVGIDQKVFVEKTHSLFTQAGFTYQTMDAAHLDFADETFDLAAISNSLHHFLDPRRILVEMKRVMKKDGVLVVFEMYNDHQPVEQQNAVRLHQWWAKLNMAKGIFHDPRYNRADLLTMLEEDYHLEWQYYDIPPEDEDPFDPELMDFIDNNIDENIKLAAELANSSELISEGEELRKQIKQNGYKSAMELLAVGSVKQ